MALAGVTLECSYFGCGAQFWERVRKVVINVINEIWTYYGVFTFSFSSRNMSQTKE